MGERLTSAVDFTKTLAEVELLLRESDEAGPGKTTPDEQKVAVMNGRLPIFWSTRNVRPAWR